MRRGGLAVPPAASVPSPNPGTGSTGSGDTAFSERFDSEYYLQRYPDVAADGGDPYEHFVTYGRDEGRHGVRPEGESAADTEPSEPFDAAYYLQRYPDVAADGGDPYEHFVTYGRAEGRHGVRPDGESSTDAERSGPFDVAYYFNRYPDVATGGGDRCEHFVMYGRGGRYGVRPEGESSTDAERSEPFDVAYYLSRYPDVAADGVDPYQHFIANGKAEGRQGVPPKLEYSGSFEQLDPQRETVLVVSHDASRTGAPILSLNIVQELKKKYNVVTMLLASGSILEDFRVASDIVVDPILLERDPGTIQLLLAQLVESVALSFAVVNSIQSRFVLRGLAEHFVPTITLIHEFAAYIRPVDAFREAALWSTATVFSAPVIYRDAIRACPDIARSNFHILPQGRCMPPVVASTVEDLDREATRITRVLRPEGLPAGTMVVLGAGSVVLRKGVDLFIDCAAKVLRDSKHAPFRFVWLGGGFDPECDMNYSVYLVDQVRRAGLENHVFFAGETMCIDAAYAAADIVLISSRLDPLPNVAIDAMAHGLPIVCFERTTGVADILCSHGLGDDCVVPYLDTGAMAEKTLELMRSEHLRQRVADRGRELVREVFDMPRYIEQIEALAMDARRRVDDEREGLGDLAMSHFPRMDFFASRHESDMSRDRALRHYARRWVTGLYRRKPLPVFQPAIYQEGMAATDQPGEPLLRSGESSAPWCYEVIEPVSDFRMIRIDARIALHVHVCRPALLPEIIERLNANETKPDLMVSVPSKQIAQEVRAMLVDYAGRVVEIKEVPNRGRDIGPLLTAFGATLMDGYEIVGHLHTKKSVDVSDATVGDRWYGFLLEHLLGGALAMADMILARMFADPTIGIVVPDDPGAIGWDGSRRYAEPLMCQLAVEALPEKFLFPVGTMFWARVDALRPLFELGLDWSDYPPEPLPDDGSLLDALKRLFGVVANRMPYRAVATSVPGSTR